MGEIKIFLFGKLSIEANRQLIQRLETRKAEELFCYLLLHRSRPHPREKLADLLWGEVSPGQSKNYLRKALWQLQSGLNLYCESDDLLLVDAEWIQINPQLDLWLDVAIFEDAFKRTQGKRGRELKDEQTQVIASAVKIYRGDLLEGWYPNWCIYQRERLQHLYIAMLDKLMDYCEAHEDYENGLMFGERILFYDRARERTHRRLMRLYFLAGDRTAALRQYEKCVAALREELDVKPAHRTRRLSEMIRSDKLELITQPDQSSGDKLAETGKERLITVFSHLNAFQNALNHLQAQLVQDIQIIKETLDGKQS